MRSTIVVQLLKSVKIRIAWLKRTKLSRTTAGKRRARCGAIFNEPGSAYLYQGEELGLPEVLDLPDERRQDPVFIRTGGQSLGRDGCRVWIYQHRSV